MPRKKQPDAVAPDPAGSAPPEISSAPKRRRASTKQPEAAAAPIEADVSPPPPPSPTPKRKRAPKAAKAENTQVDTDETVPSDPDGRITVSFRPIGKKGTAQVVVAAVDIVTPTTPIVSAEDELPVLMWRPREAVKTAGGPVAHEEGEARGAGKLTRRSRRKKRSDETPPSEEFVPTHEAPPEPVAPPTPPPLPKKPAIAIPDNAPQVVMRNGVPTLVRDHRVYPPIVFFGNPADERRAAIVFEELQMAADSGVHLHSFLVELAVDPETVVHAVSLAGYLLSKAIEVDPEAQVIFRLEIKASRGWEQKFPNALYRTAAGDQAEPSVCDNGFWGVAEECLELFVRQVLQLEAASHLMGVHLERGEWFFPEGHGFDNSRAATLQFRSWARRRYLNDEVTLRASWFDGGIEFDTIQVPEFRPTGTAHERFIRSSRKQRRYVDYHLFLGDATVARIGDLAYAVKAASAGMLLVGVSYGYTFEWSHPDSGHLALGKLLRTEEIDFVGGPPSYRNRQPGGSAAFPCPIDSFALNGKLYISEEDFKTSLSTGHEPDDFNPALKTPQALESVHWRGTGAALAHGTGVEWMDLWGNGWLRTNSVWERAGSVIDVLTDRMEAPLGDPDVAVFIDERALAYLVDSKAFDLLVHNVRESVVRAGVSAAFYLLSDLAHREKFPESRLYLFINAWDIRPELRAAIKSRLQRDDKVLFWLYSAGLFDAGRDSLERAREVTGIALKPQPFYSRAGTTILNRRHPLSEAFPDRQIMADVKLEPSYFAIPEDGIVLGEYTQTGLPSFVVKESREDPNARWTSVFLGEPVVNPALIRALAQMAGAHVWNYQDDVVHARGPFCAVHCSRTGPLTITLPTKCCAYNLLARDWTALDSTHLRFTAIDGSTHLFLIGPKTEIQHFLNANPVDVLRIEIIPPRELNVRVDTANFDVPIMKLGEWIEGGDQDEVADEWFLRPQQLLDESLVEPAQAEETDHVGSRRRRRRRRGRGAGESSERTAAEEFVTPGSNQAEDEPFTMSVVFRKRE